MNESVGVHGRHGEDVDLDCGNPCRNALPEPAARKSAAGQHKQDKVVCTSGEVVYTSDAAVHTEDKGFHKLVVPVHKRQAADCKSSVADTKSQW